MTDTPTMHVSPGWEAVADRAASVLPRAGGGGLCVYHHGVPVLDVWAGVSDPATGRPWTAETMAMSFSTTKGIASACVHMLSERGLIDLDARVGEYWPEFAVNGKEATTVRHILAMEAGLYDIRHLIDNPWLMLDHDEMARRLAAAAPAHPPGTANGYHALTYGWLVGELVRRRAGVTLGRFVRTEIAEPLGLDGCYIGTPDDELSRVAALPEQRPERSSVRRLARWVNPVTSRLGFSPERMAAAFFAHDGDQVIGSRAFLRPEIPAANGVFTARSLARIYAALGSHDGVDGVRLWSATTRDAARAAQNSRRDLVLPATVGWRSGFHRPLPFRRRPTAAFGFFGAFGSGAFADPERSLAVGLVCQAATGRPMVPLIALRSRIDAAVRASGS
ncbi:MAG: serine hydrolase domain-containing protein [Acidimicrobiales bacterium]